MISTLNNHEFLWIDEGMSCMGSNVTDPYSGERDQPLREVYVSGFAMSRCATSRRQLQAFLSDTDYVTDAYMQQLSRRGLPRAWVGGNGDLPATNVSWELASAYCAWLSERSGEHVALPTEAEWEKAARGGQDRIWPWGDDFDATRCNSLEGQAGLSPVDGFILGASPYGCLNMAGGVWEWCVDYYHSYSHQAAALLDPVNLTPAVQRVVKGGSAYCTKEIVRPSCRDWTNSYNQGGGDDGFRVCIRPWR